ncbi:MAG: DUF1146 family protein [Acholeplasmataceae bacterium]|jgi:uncharacterized membrane protein YwzB
MPALISYFGGLVIGTFLTFIILRATNFERLFHQGKIFEIRVAYILVSIFGGHLVGRIIYFIVDIMTKIN